jgi:23S rRNA (cytosine1962-C5)-methyltransferase
VMKRETGQPNEPQAILTVRGVERVRSGHLWIYRSDIAEVTGADSGDLVTVRDRRGNFLAWAHYGAESEISLRLISSQQTKPDRDFWHARLRSAYEWRAQVVAGTDAYRLVHAEGDLLPGLIIDRYGDCFSFQTLTRGMEALKGMWVELLIAEFSPRMIVERNDVKVRSLEGLPMFTRVFYSAYESAEAQLICTENGVRYHVDLIEGQKTGAFLDQRENRSVALEYGRGRGLDCFSFHGSFALHLAKTCDQVTAIDISSSAIERARRNADLNGQRNIEFVEGNVFDELHRRDEMGERFETIVLDPPAFAKNRRAIEAALRGYKEINLRAMRLLRPGGILITCSCSYHVKEEMFLGMLHEAAHDSHRSIQIVEKRTQARDHPVLLNVPETYYLKCIVLRVAE